MITKLLVGVVGYRTYIVSALCGILAILIQADAQGIIVLAPLVKLTFEFGLVIALPFIPVFLRKGIEDALSKEKKAGEK